MKQPTESEIANTWRDEDIIQAYNLGRKDGIEAQERASDLLYRIKKYGM